MKATFKRWALDFLRSLAKRRLRAIRPLIVGVTGSVGKTGAKDAIADVLGRRFSVRRSEKNLNSEFGTVLTILGLKTGYSSTTAWISIFWKAIWEAFKKPEKYQMLVLEMGVDKPGDMDEILKVFTPNIMVFLNVKNVHVGAGQFANRQAVYEEKSKAVVAVPPGGWVILNHDDSFVRQLEGHLPAHTITIGTEEGADLCAKDIEMSTEGLMFTLSYDQRDLFVRMPHVLGKAHITLVLAAVAVGFVNGMPWKAIQKALEEYRLPPGRMNRIEGKNGALILDSSYNASPDTMEAGLEILSLFHGRKIAALGTMNELGELAVSEHIKVGKLAAEQADMLLAVGEHASALAEGAQRAGMSASMIHVFNTSKEAGQFLSKILDKHDTVLAKGSQNRVRMEHLVKMCMKHPEEARELLVRQDAYWSRRP
ncbi:UDP-N-acetylmuramoyl-tripeptide--D-alanyl-D-alanine ligase [Candidatus Peregrinibacteria bacterium]|nr:MAG: UDP-N-acetylmuramoyl-tripeptide--D-alanyl-D-alanine ligase [Candidatus Peregrinibacteria bacterium]